MTEVRESSSGSSMGLFATKSFAKGEVILLEEHPIVVVAPVSDDESKSMMVELVGDKKPIPSPSKQKRKQQAPTTSLSLLEAIDPPSGVPKALRGTFQGLVQAGLCWMKKEQQQTPEDKEALLQLYHPSRDTKSTQEQSLLDVIDIAVDYLKRNKPEPYAKYKDWEMLEKIMLIWACNSFEGGRIYSKISRVNHNCNPNAIIQPDGEVQRLVAADDISAGDEVTISYLGLLLYAETTVRNQHLHRSKFFDCQCARCLAIQNDKAAQIPCPSCHPRERPQQSLTEDVQYDDDQMIQYIVPNTTCPKCQSRPETIDAKLQTVLANVTQKLVHYLETHETSQKGSGGDDNGEQEVLEEHVSLASTVMGDKHWTTNLLMMLLLDRRLTTMSQRMLTSQELPELDEVAESIDSLQRVSRYVECLDLKLDGGHILGDVIIGVARTLVSLGDVKSQKYGAEWLDKISDYIDMFESDGKQKVVAALRVAWENNDGEEHGNGEDSRKKAKRS